MGNKIINFNKIRVVWNLTNRCPFKCAMCVASANNRIERNVDKYQILQSIFSVGLKNISIDFSGGDPLFINEDIEIVKKASQTIGRENISISSTGLSISKFTDEEVISLANSYDMTYDFPKQYCEDDIRDKRYNSINYDQCIRLKKLGLNVDVFVPIRDIDNIYLEQLAKDICEISPNSVKLLKCMPLNNNFNTDKIDSVNKVIIFKKYLREYGYIGDIKINCALKEDFNINDNCNMLTERKVGLDQFGNLYTCIWASDLLIEKKDNPFYLGSLVQNSLLDILNSFELSNKLNKINENRHKCYVLEFYNKSVKKTIQSE